jgi:hypothetical protein
MSLWSPKRREVRTAWTIALSWTILKNCEKRKREVTLETSTVWGLVRREASEARLMGPMMKRWTESVMDLF